MSRLVLPICLLGMLGGFLLPLPGTLIDILIITNGALALILFFSVLYLDDPLQLSALPGILLILTLFRLALNVSTTRVILGEGPVSQVIEAFGRVVIQDQLAVGVCIFLMITVIQFIVIARGSERVAEVSARFMLDAMPGQQMAIDADLRSGFLDSEEARSHRKALQTESRFYGALDGSMKFIKGDAIAGLFITTLNVCGGLLLGICSYGLSLNQALSQYTLLTIGDGLSSQFPALLNSLTAGMMVTRVQRDDATLARELIQQLAGSTSVRLGIGMLFLGIGTITDFPFLPLAVPGLFLVMSAGMSMISTSKPVVEDQGQAPGLPLLELCVPTEGYNAHVVQEILQEELRRMFLEDGLLIDMPTLKQNTEKETYGKLLLRGECILRMSDTTAEACHRVQHQLRRCLHDHRCELIDDRMVRKLLLYAEHVFHDRVSDIVPGIISVTQCTVLLRHLVRGGLSIRNLDVILQAIAEQEQKERDEISLIRAVRLRMGSSISARVAPNGVLRGITFGPELDQQMVRLAAGETEDVAVVSQVLYAAANVQTTYPKVIAVSERARSCIEELFILHGGKGYVVSHEEISPTIEYACELLEAEETAPDTDNRTDFNPSHSV